MTILVTGAAGFIGSNICRQFLLKNPNVTIVGLDNYSPYYSPSLKKRRVETLITHKRFIFVKSSFCQTSTLLAIQKKYKPTTLIHTAAEVGVRNGETHPLSYIKTNTLGTATLLETIGRKLHHAILFSSSSVYGDANLPFNETAGLHPLSVYGVSKATMEEYANNYYSRTRVPITIVRPFSIYGPDGRPDMLPMKLLFASQSGQIIKITGKNTKRDWTYIDDLSSAIVSITVKPKKLQHINVGFGKPLSNMAVVKIAEKIIEQFGCRLRYEFASLNPIETSTTWADSTTLQNQYNVRMPTRFEKGFQKTADFFFSHKYLYTLYV